jgi:uncharacterized protein
MHKDLWYRDGLRFECVRCGQCCTGAPGNVWVSPASTRALGAHLGLSETEFLARHTRAGHRAGVRLIEKPNQDCIFYEREPDANVPGAGSPDVSSRGAGNEPGCRVYALRPRQCRTWPFWRRNLRSAAAWADAAETCPGMDRGRLYTLEEIHVLSVDDGLPGVG